MDLLELKKRIAEFIVQDKYVDALIECGKALRIDAQDTQVIDIVIFLNSRILEAHGDMQCQTAEDYTHRGIAMFYSDKMGDALLDYNRAIDLDSNYDWAYKCRHLIYASEGKIKEAHQDLLTAIKINPSGEYYNDLGNLLGLLQKKDESLSCHLKAVELCPDIAQYWYNFGVGLMEHGYFQDALLKYNKAIELWPQYEDALVNRQYVQSLLNKN